VIWALSLPRQLEKPLENENHEIPHVIFPKLDSLLAKQRVRCGHRDAHMTYIRCRLDRHMAQIRSSAFNLCQLDVISSRRRLHFVTMRFDSSLLKSHVVDPALPIYQPLSSQSLALSTLPSVLVPSVATAIPVLKLCSCHVPRAIHRGVQYRITEFNSILQTTLRYSRPPPYNALLSIEVT
jgi:hypothetical protein